MNARRDSSSSKTSSTSSQDSNTSSSVRSSIRTSQVSSVKSSASPGHNRRTQSLNGSYLKASTMAFECHRVTPDVPGTPTIVRRCQSVKSPGSIKTSTSVNHSSSSLRSTSSRRRRRRLSSSGSKMSEVSSENYFRYKTPKADLRTLKTIRITSSGSGAKNGESVHRVLILGVGGCGKSTLIESFKSHIMSLSPRDSHYLNGSQDDEEDDDDDDDDGLVLFFREVHDLDNYLSPIRPDAYVIVYSVSDRKSFESAKDILRQVRQFEQEDFGHKPVILVANKTDLVRTRSVSKNDGRQLAMDIGVKYIETSCTISLNVDFLLVGLRSQIDLKKGSRKGSSSRKPNILRRLLNRTMRIKNSRSCDNLNVL